MRQDGAKVMVTAVTDKNGSSSFKPTASITAAVGPETSRGGSSVGDVDSGGRDPTKRVEKRQRTGAGNGEGAAGGDGVACLPPSPPSYWRTAKVVEAKFYGDSDGTWNKAILGAQLGPDRQQVMFVGYEADGWQDTAAKDVRYPDDFSALCRGGPPVDVLKDAMHDRGLDEEDFRFLSDNALKEAGIKSAITRARMLRRIREHFNLPLQKFAPAPRLPPLCTLWSRIIDDEDWREVVGCIAVYKTRFMRRKLEYLMRHCATSENLMRLPCPGKEKGFIPRTVNALRGTRVVEVQRIENREVWDRYAKRLAAQPASWGKESRSVPVNCEMYEEERFLFHGTQPEFLDSIAQEGLKLPPRGINLRFGQGIYFSDESCKAHQYAGRREKEDGSTEFCLLYCRVLLGRTLEFKATNEDANLGFLHGMQQPVPQDPVFRSAMLRRGSGLFSSLLGVFFVYIRSLLTLMLRRGAVKKACEEYDSIVASSDLRGVAQGGSPAQIHREFVVFDKSQVRERCRTRPRASGLCCCVDK